MTQNAQVYDRFVSEDFTNFLFKEKKNDFGADLVARNIQVCIKVCFLYFCKFHPICRGPEITQFRATASTERPAN